MERCARSVLMSMILLAAAAPAAHAQQDRVNTIKDVFARLYTCWKPPPPARANPMDITVIVSFNRSGEILGRPKITFESAEASDNDRLAYRLAVMETLQRCTDAIYRGHGRRRRGPSLHGSVPHPETSISNGEKSMAVTENTLILETTQGPVTIEMRPDLAPNHVARIKELVREGFYDGIVFHRVIDGFMAQTGCPQGTGTGGSGKKLKAEFNKEKHVRGTVSMARAANPDSGDSQFFICFADAPFLNGQYTVWGAVTEGMENIDKIKRGEPVINPDKIIKARMADAA